LPEHCPAHLCAPTTPCHATSSPPSITPATPTAATHRKELLISKREDDKTDAQRLTPGELSEERAYITQLQVGWGRRVFAHALHQLWSLRGGKGTGGRWCVSQRLALMEDATSSDEDCDLLC